MVDSEIVYSDDISEQYEQLKLDPWTERLKKSREELAYDPARPLYHFSSTENVMNDANGLSHWQGKYHLFYQFVPSELPLAERELVRQQKHMDRHVLWGHTVSDDLIHWRDLPPALYPTTEVDCFSGQSLVEDDRVIAIYHGTHSGNALATSSDPLLLNWEKHPDNPVITGEDIGNGDVEIPSSSIKGIDTGGRPVRIFDPCIWKETDAYYALSGAYWKGKFGGDVRGFDATGVDHLFRSEDLANWDYIGPLFDDGFFQEPGEDCAVPNFWPIGNGKHMLLLFSHKRGGRYYLGNYDEDTHKFTPESHGRMCYGAYNNASLHAPSATVDAAGRYLGVFNTKEGWPDSAWRDTMTLTRHYWLADDNSLRQAPAGDVESLRFNHERFTNITIDANQEIVLPTDGGKAIELQITIDPKDAREVGFSVLRSSNAEEQTRISFLRQYGGRLEIPDLLQIDISESSLNEEVWGRPAEIGPLELDSEEKLHLRVFVDRSIIEVFANDKQCLTVRVNPEREDSRGISFYSRGSSSELVQLDMWQMQSIWPELKQFEGK